MNAAILPMSDMTQSNCKKKINLGTIREIDCRSWCMRENTRSFSSFLSISLTPGGSFTEKHKQYIPGHLTIDSCVAQITQILYISMFGDYI